MKRAADDRDDEVLSGPVADRLLARASELDAKRATGATIADLRAAASEAGISRAYRRRVRRGRAGRQVKIPA